MTSEPAKRFHFRPLTAHVVMSDGTIHPANLVSIDSAGTATYTLPPELEGVAIAWIYVYPTGDIQVVDLRSMTMPSTT